MNFKLSDDEFCVPFKDEFDYEKFMLKERGMTGGTCQLENSILYFKRQKDSTITNLQFRLFVIQRATDNKHINHLSLVYFQNGKMFIESRSNFIHKKLLFTTYKTHNKIVKSENGKDLLYNIIT